MSSERQLSDHRDQHKWETLKVLKGEEVRGRTPCLEVAEAKLGPISMYSFTPLFPGRDGTLLPVRHLRGDYIDQYISLLSQGRDYIMELRQRRRTRRTRRED